MKIFNRQNKSEPKPGSKRRWPLRLGIVAIVLILALLICPIPRWVHCTLDGVCWDTETGETEGCSVLVKGWYFYSLTGQCSFSGLLKISCIEESTLYEEKDIDFSQNTQVGSLCGELYVFNSEENQIQSLGSVYIPKSFFKSFSELCFMQHEGNLMVAAPATALDEAKAISLELTGFESE